MQGLNTHCPPLPPALQVRVVKQQPVDRVATLLAALFSPHDSADTIGQLFLGVSAHQKLELLSSLLRLLGFESVAVFGDCFDEVRGVGGVHMQRTASAGAGSV